VVWKADYKPFGEENTVTANPKNNKEFAGKEKDEETGLYYFGARYMEPKIGRFTAVDPVRAVDPHNSITNEEMLLNPQRVNSYAYAFNNPYKFVDPFGLTADLILFPAHSNKHDDIIHYKGAQNVRTDSKVYQIASHGNERGIFFDGKLMMATQFADYLRDTNNHTGYKEGTAIRLLGCNMGHGENSFAQQLANVLGVKVEGASDFFWLPESGNYRIAASMGKDKKGNRIEDDTRPGKMIPFRGSSLFCMGNGMTETYHDPEVLQLHESRNIIQHSPWDQSPLGG
jgi:RHS repeat-associated protein